MWECAGEQHTMGGDFQMAGQNSIYVFDSYVKNNMRMTELEHLQEHF
jgi:hypothetical protein